MDAMVDDFMIFQQEELGKTQKNLDHNFSVFCEIWAAHPPPPQLYLVSGICASLASGV